MVIFLKIWLEIISCFLVIYMFCRSHHAQSSPDDQALKSGRSIMTIRSEGGLVGIYITIEELLTILNGHIRQLMYGAKILYEDLHHYGLDHFFMASFSSRWICRYRRTSIWRATGDGSDDE